MPLEIVHFPDNPPEPDRRWCFVWTRALDGKQIRFGCSTEEDCKAHFEQFNARAEAADAKLLETM